MISSVTLFHSISGHTGNEGNQTTSLDPYEEGYFNESDDEDDQRLDDFGDKIDQFLSSVSPPPSATKAPLSEGGRRPLLEEAASDDEEGTIAIDNGNNTNGGLTPSFPIPPLKHKRDHEDDDEDDVLAAKASKRLGQVKPSVLKPTPTPLLGATTGDDEDDTTTIDNENNTIGDPSPPMPLRSLKLRSDDEDDDEDDVLATKTSKRQGQDKPGVSKRN